jgi:Mor family transcriptional regulator
MQRHEETITLALLPAEERPDAKQDARQPNLDSVRSLVTSVTDLARHLKLTTNAIYRWIKVNRIPGNDIIKVANFYDVDPRDLLPLTGSDKSNEVRLSLKSRTTLKTLMRVFRGEITLAEAMTITGQSKISLKLIMTHWGDELPTLYTTLEQLDQKRINLNEACRRLNVAKSTMHGIRRKYGYAPGYMKRTRPESTLPARKSRSREIAIACISGKFTVHDAAYDYKLSERTIFRAISEISNLKMSDLAVWPVVYREAYAEEIECDLPKFAEKWLQFGRANQLFVNKSPKYQKTPENWRSVPLKRMLAGYLLGEALLEEIADSRGADVEILAQLFTSDLRPLGLTLEQVQGMSSKHQLALADLLLAMLDRKRGVIRL